jgi:uncharacterized membrane protein YfcA
MLGSLSSWFLSTLAGGGTPLILIPLIGLFLGPNAVPPVVTIGMLLGHPQRIFLYWQNIDWNLTKWYAPGAILGAILGAFIFTKIKLEWLTIVIAVLLIISTFSYGKTGQKNFQVKAWYFLPAGFIYAVLSGIVGSTGPLLNPLYLNYGLKKEEMIGTKSTHLVLIHLVKIITYFLCGALSFSYLKYGLILGIAALPGNYLGQIALKYISEKLFRRLVIGFVTFSGILIIGEEFWGKF